MTETTPLWLKVLHLFILVHAQFAAICRDEHPDPERPAATGCQQWQQFPSMIMMLSMSIGVALAGTLINVFGQHVSTASPHHRVPCHINDTGLYQPDYRTGVLANSKEMAD